MSGLHPVLDARLQLRVSMHERHVRSRPVQLQRGFRRRVAAADDDDVLPVEAVRLVVVVRHVRKVLARHADEVRMIEVADREDDVAAVTNPANAFVGSRFDVEDRCPRLPRVARSAACAEAGIDVHHLLAELDLQFVGVDDAAVVAQRFDPRRLFKWRHERQPADLEQLRRREEHHVDRESIDRIDEHALFDNRVVEPDTLGRNAGGQPGRAGAHDGDVANLHFRVSLATRIRRIPDRQGRRQLDGASLPTQAQPLPIQRKNARKSLICRYYWLILGPDFVPRYRYTVRSVRL